MLCLPIYPGLPRKVQNRVMQVLIEEAIQREQASRAYLRPLVDAVSLLAATPTAVKQIS